MPAAPITIADLLKEAPPTVTITELLRGRDLDISLPRPIYNGLTAKGRARRS